MPLNVLIADDSRTSRTYLLKCLQVFGFPVAEAHEVATGKLAVDLMSAKQIDILFLDINMPGMGGIEVVEWLRQAGKMEQTRVIMVTAEGSNERLGKLRELGVTRFLRKPFKPEEFSGLVAEFLEREKDGAK